MKSQATTIGASALAAQYNDLRKDAYGGSFLLPREQSTPDLTLRVENGVCYVGATRVIFAGGNSPSFTAPAANPRIDLLTIDSAGTLARVAGTEAASPTAPTYPADKLVICEVYNRVGQTTIRDVDTTGQGYIYNDVRPFLGGAYIALATQIADGIITADKLNQVYVQTTGDSTIAGIKTFGSIPVLPASNPTTDNQAVRKLYVDGKLFAYYEMSPASKGVTVVGWTDWDLSAEIPAGAKYVEIVAIDRVSNTAYSLVMGVRKNGSALGRNISFATGIVAAETSWTTELDAGRIVELYYSNATYNTTTYIAIGYWL